MSIRHKINATSLSVILILLSLFFAINVALAWTEPIELTHVTSTMDAKGVVVGRSLYLVAIANPSFVFMSSYNNGFSWTAPIDVADTFFEGGLNPDMAADSLGVLHIIMRGRVIQDPVRDQLFHISSTDRGRTWGPQRQRLFYNNLAVGLVSLATKGDSLFVLCRGNEYIILIRSLDGGLTWQDSTVLDSVASMTYHPTLLYCNGRLHAIYSIIDAGDTTGYEVFTRHSDDYGLTWSPLVALSTVEGGARVSSQFPSAYADVEGQIMVCWFDYKYGSYCGGTGDILARVSTDNGDSWLPESRLTHTQSGQASSCLIVNNVLYVVWMDSWPVGCNYPKIKYSVSSDWGTSWSNPAIITGPEIRREQSPLLLQSFQGQDTLFHCFFDLTTPYFATQYTRSIRFLSNHILLPPNREEIFKIRTTPVDYNSKTLITYEAAEGGEMELEIYDVMGRKLWSKEVYGRGGSLIWDGCDQRGNRACSGVYILRARKAETEKTARIVILKQVYRMPFSNLSTVYKAIYNGNDSVYMRIPLRYRFELRCFDLPAKH